MVRALWGSSLAPVVEEDAAGSGLGEGPERAGRRRRSPALEIEDEWPGGVWCSIDLSPGWWKTLGDGYIGSTFTPG